MTTQNRLLADLPQDVLSRVAPCLDVVQARQHTVLIAPGQRLDSVYFVETGLVSLILRLADGRAAEVGLVGAEGMAGIPLLLGSDVSAAEALAQAPCSLLRLGAEPLRRFMDELPAFRAALLRYALAAHDHAAQLAACNAHHTLDQRFARWLLTVADRLGMDEVPMTQEFLALMLCVQRPAVTVAARLFQQAALIQYTRGHIALRNRAGLEAVSCECYAATRPAPGGAHRSRAVRTATRTSAR